MNQKLTPTQEEPLRFEPWMRGLLLIAGIYNLAWGFFIYNFPNAFYQWVTRLESPAVSIIIWQGLGVMIFGVLYVLIAIYPKKLWYLIVLGMLSKAVGAVWFYAYIMDMRVTKQFYFHLIMNDLIWILPFIVMVIRAARVYGFIKK